MRSIPQAVTWTICDITEPPFSPISKPNSPSFLLTMTNFQLVLNALDKYAEQTGIDLKENLFADKVLGCDSSASILLPLQENVKVFKYYRDNNRKFINCVSLVVQFVHAFSDILGEAAGLVSSDQPLRPLIVYSFRFHSNLQNLSSSASMSSSPCVFSWPWNSPTEHFEIHSH
jgi:hypothetical protein